MTANQFSGWKSAGKIMGVFEAIEQSVAGNIPGGESMGKRSQQAYAAEQRAAGQIAALVLELLKLKEEEGLSDEEFHALMYGEAGALRRRQFIRSGKTPIATAVQQHTIDCDATPFIPGGWSVEEHRKGGRLIWDKAAQARALYLSPNQQNGGRDVGHKLREELKSQPVLNACVLDYLLANPTQIPDEWKGRYIFFWGTISRDSEGFLYVRYLYWDGDQWDWGDYWLNSDWNDDGPAAVSAS